MPYQNREARLAYLKEYREKNKKKVREQIKKIKHEKYGGICPVCGKKTSGTGPNNTPSMHCEEHKSRTWLVKKNMEQEETKNMKIVPFTTNRGARFSRLRKDSNAKDSYGTR